MAKDRNMGSHIGSWAFLIGVLLAVILGLVASFSGGSMSQGWVIVLVVLGLVIGFLNVGEHEVTPFLWSGAVLVLVAGMGSGVLGAIPIVDQILQALLALFIPATIIVAVKNVFVLARN